MPSEDEGQIIKATTLLCLYALRLRSEEHAPLLRAIDTEKEM
jgi:hypothetical protein